MNTTGTEMKLGSVVRWPLTKVNEKRGKKESDVEERV